LSPRKITIIFITSDFWSLVLQAGGGAIATIADNVSFEYVGIHLMLAGLALQVLSLVIVLTLGIDFAISCSKKPQSWSDKYTNIRERRYFKGFIYGKKSKFKNYPIANQVFATGLVIATVFILIRSSYRVAELVGGFHGKLWNSEVYFMTLDGTMVAIASILLTALHPGLAFHGQWGSVKRSPDV